LLRRAAVLESGPDSTYGRQAAVAGEAVKITQSLTALNFVVPKEPKQAGIDPYNKLIDRTPDDNILAVSKR
jgi:hypothetical protein